MKILVRRVEASDRDDVLEISRHIWEGHDYLPSVFDEWVKDPACNFFGVEADGLIVAVGNLRLLQADHTGWMEGLRVHPDYRRRGFANSISQRVMEEAERLGLERLRYTTSEENEASLKLAKKAGFKKLVRMAVSWYFKLEQVQKVSSCLEVRKTSPESTFELLNLNSRVAPRGIVMYDWKALDVTRANIKAIGKTHTFYVSMREKHLDSLSIASVEHGEDHSHAGFTIYAVNAPGFLSQLYYNMGAALRCGADSVACTFQTKFEPILKKTGIVSGDYQETHLVLVERQMRPKKRKGSKVS